MSKILVVDDSAVDRRLVEGILEKEWEVGLAENGRQALERLQAEEFEIIVTDMVMPEVDGLELLREVRRLHPHLPVILMTSQGSEALASKALREGAASYVPKQHLAQLLPQTISDLLSLTYSERSYERLLDCARRNAFYFALDNDPALIHSLIDLVQQMVESLGLGGGIGRLRIGMALEQALLNGLFRGNLEIPADDVLAEATAAQRRRESPYKDRKLFVEMDLTREEARFVVRDEGPGFDVSAWAVSPGDSSLAVTERRGILLMRTLMDDVRYNGKGNEVTLIKRRAVPATAQPAAEAAAEEPAEAEAAPLPVPKFWGEVPRGARVTDVISGRSYRVQETDDGVVLTATTGGSMSFKADQRIDDDHFRVYMLPGY